MKEILQFENLGVSVKIAQTEEFITPIVSICQGLPRKSQSFE